MLLGQLLASMWYWCVDQTMVQRVLSAKGVAHARKGCLLAGYLKILPPFLMVFPGIIARAFFAECQRTEGQLHADWCETDLGDANESSKAYPLLIAKMFPDGLRGLLIVSMVLAMMSSLDSVFNCLSTIFTYDIYKRFLHPEASRRRQVWIGQLATGVAALCGLAWLPMIANSANGLYLTTQSAQTHMSPTLVAVFLVGLFWPRANGPGALAGMIVRFTVGIARFVATRLVTCDEGDTYSLTCMQFNHMALILFAIAAIVTVVVSLLTKPPEPSQVQGTTWWRSDAARCENEGDGNPGLGSLCAAGILLTTMAGLCLGFGYSGADRQVVVEGSLLAPIGIACVAVVFIAGALLQRLLASKRHSAKQITGLQPDGAEADQKAAEEPTKDDGVIEM